MRRPQDDPGPDGRDRWLVSYADFITLLFAFFAVMYALSSLDVQKWERVSAGVASAFAGLPEPGDPMPLPLPVRGSRGERATAANDGEAPGESAWELLQLKSQLESALEARGLSGDGPRDPVRLAVDPRGLRIALSSSHLFPPGRARLRPEALAAVDEIGGALATTAAELRVEGHADDDEPKGGPYPSGWELSAARAAAVARRLIESHRVRPERIGIAGFAGHRPPASGERRRVEITVLTSSGPEAAPDSDSTLRGLLDQLEPLPGSEASRAP